MVKPGDVVNFDGATLTQREKVYILLNKLKTTTMDEGQECLMFGLVKLCF
jgi:23S rRNA pseudouridine2605 synthase